MRKGIIQCVEDLNNTTTTAKWRNVGFSLYVIAELECWSALSTLGSQNFGLKLESRSSAFYLSSLQITSWVGLSFISSLQTTSPVTLILHNHMSQYLVIICLYVYPIVCFFGKSWLIQCFDNLSDSFLMWLYHFTVHQDSMNIALLLIVWLYERSTVLSKLPKNRRGGDTT